MRPHLLTSLVAVVILTFAAAPTIGAQQRIPGGGKGPGIGFNYHGVAELGANGKPRWVDFPVVTAVDSGSAPMTAGLLPGDVIIEVNGHDGHEPGLFRERSPGTPYRVKVRRGADTLTIEWVVPTPPTTP